MQQIPFIYLFLDPFESAVHVSGDKFAHLQEHFLTVYTVKSGAEDGRVCLPKHVQQIQMDQEKDK